MMAIYNYMASFQQVILFFVYAALAVYGLHYHSATPLLHAASFLSLIYLIKNGIKTSLQLDLISKLWLLTLIIWPLLYVSAYLL